MGKVKNVIIIHGYGADPFANWFPWLEMELGAVGLNAKVPDFGQDLQPNFSRWRSVLDKSLEGLDPSETVLVGHSLGGALIARYFTSYEKDPFLACFLVAAPYDDLDWDNLKDFFEESTMKSSSRKKMGKVYILASDDDPHVPVEHCKKFEELFDGKVFVEKNMEHLWQPQYARLRELILEFA